MEDRIFYLDGDDGVWCDAEANGAMTDTMNKPSEPTVGDRAQRRFRREHRGRGRIKPRVKKNRLDNIHVTCERLGGGRFEIRVQTPLTLRKTAARPSITLRSKKFSASNDR